MAFKISIFSINNFLPYVKRAISFRRENVLALPEHCQSLSQVIHTDLWIILTDSRVERVYLSDLAVMLVEEGGKRRE